MSRAQTVIAFHGTVKENVQRIIDNGFEAKPVQLDYKRPREMTKWLGRGAYFYIGNPALAWDWAVLGTTSRPSWCKNSMRYRGSARHRTVFRSSRSSVAKGN